jgi:hypothetical protein
VRNATRWPITIYDNSHNSDKLFIPFPEHVDTIMVRAGMTKTKTPRNRSLTIRNDVFHGSHVATRAARPVFRRGADRTPHRNGNVTMSKRTNAAATSTKTVAKTGGRKRAAKTPVVAETPKTVVYAPRQRDNVGLSMKHRCYAEYHRALIAGETPVDLTGVQIRADATGIKMSTLKSWVADWRSAAPRGVAGPFKTHPLHVAAHGGDVAKMRAALVAYDKSRNPAS